MAVHDEVVDTPASIPGDAGTVVVVPDHYDGMLRCSGTLTLEDDGGATTETITGRLEVRVPLLSGAAEKAIYGGFTRHLGIEAAALGSFCASRS